MAISGALSAPASLKPRIAQGVQRSLYVISGALSAPASLKPDSTRERCTPVPPISGALSAPASLKRDYLLSSSVETSFQISGSLKCSGLIEAPRAGAATHPSRNISGALSAPASLKRSSSHPLPALRPDFRSLKCSGLIEARIYAPAWSPSMEISGALSAPASLKRKNLRRRDLHGQAFPEP